MIPRVLSGVQPSGNLHIGNYLGALSNWVRIQHDYESIFCIVDLHAITVFQKPDELRGSIRDLAALFLAAGIDPKHSRIVVQSSVPAHAELAWLLTCVTPMGWLERMTQYKAKAAAQESVGSGLFQYPVLMAADILLYQAAIVPVGEDQKQHVELMRDIAGAFNRHYDTDYFPLPEPLISGPATRVMSLRDGSKKMSKSDASEYSRINLSDDAEQIAQKIRKAKTDPEPLPSEEKGLEGRAEAANLVGIFAALSGREKTGVLAEYGGANFSTFKNALVDLAVEKLSPITAEMRKITANHDYIDTVLRDGAERARALANENMKAVKDIVGFLR